MPPVARFSPALRTTGGNNRPRERIRCGAWGGLDLRVRPDSLINLFPMVSSALRRLLSNFLVAAVVLLLPVRLAADLVWSPQTGWRLEGGALSGLTGTESRNALELMNKARTAEEMKYIDQLVRSGAGVEVLCLTHGEASTLHGAPGDLASLRGAELAAAAEVQHG